MHITGNLRIHNGGDNQLIKSKVVQLVSRSPIESCLDSDPAKGAETQQSLFGEGRHISVSTQCSVTSLFRYKLLRRWFCTR
jgi:hypothetical protein